MHGSVVSGFLDPEAAATVNRALEAAQPPDGPEDTRSLAQRNADALVLHEPAVARWRAPRVATDRGHRRGRHRTTCSPAGPLTELDALRCDIEGFGPIAARHRRTARRATARSVEWSRGPQSEILDLGRRTRTIPRAAAAGDTCCATSTASIPAAGRRPRGATCTISSTGCRGGETQPENLRAVVPTSSRRLPRGRLEAGARTQRPYAGGVSDDVSMPASSRRGSPGRRRCCAASGVRRAVRCVHRVLHVVAVRAHRARRDRHARAHPGRAACSPRPGCPRATSCSGTTSTGTARCWSTTAARSTSTVRARAAPTTAGCSRPPASSPTRPAGDRRPGPPAGASTSTPARSCRSRRPTTRRRQRVGAGAQRLVIGRFGEAVRDRRDRRCSCGTAAGP